MGPKVSKTTQFYKVILKFITPVVLLGGLLVLAVYHFHGVLKISAADVDSFHGVFAFSAGDYQMLLRQNAGTDRPAISYSGNPVLSYSDWSSDIIVDGQTQVLWDAFHGYSVDTTKQQVFSTSSGTGWQVVEVATLVDAHTVQVTYSLDVISVGPTTPTRITLTIAHVQPAYWLDPTTQGTTFTAQVLSSTALSNLAPNTGPTGELPTTQTLVPVGQVSLNVSGPALISNGVQMPDYRSVTGGGVQQGWASVVDTTYTVTNPAINVLIPLGTETVTFTPNAASAGTPGGAPLSPTQAPTH